MRSGVFTYENNTPVEVKEFKERLMITRALSGKKTDKDYYVKNHLGKLISLESAVKENNFRALHKARIWVLDFLHLEQGANNTVRFDNVVYLY